MCYGQLFCLGPTNENFLSKFLLAKIGQRHYGLQQLHNRTTASAIGEWLRDQVRQLRLDLGSRQAGEWYSHRPYRPVEVAESDLVRTY